MTAPSSAMPTAADPPPLWVWSRAGSQLPHRLECRVFLASTIWIFGRHKYRSVFALETLVVIKGKILWL